MEEWKHFKHGSWEDTINVRDFILTNFNTYSDDETFLSQPTKRTKELWAKVLKMMTEERNRGIYDAETKKPSTIVSHEAGYIEKENEQIVGLQTDKPLKRGIMPNGGLRMVLDGLEYYGYELAPELKEFYSKNHKTHNDGVFDLYTAEMRAARKSAIITGLPDAYGRGRIIGDYRRVALYGTDRLISAKKMEKAEECKGDYLADTMLLVEELAEQIRALEELKVLAKSYGYDISKPARNAHEAIQWTYFAYLAAVKEQNGAAMSLGRVSNFLDIYIERDLNNGLINEEDAQEFIDHFVMKLRMVRFLRTPAYDELFSGDPTWVTESIGGVSCDGRALVTKTSMRFLHTLYNLGPAPEPNITILWSEKLPLNFKKYCARVSIETSSIQYENDDNMREHFSDDYGIACCVSPMEIGKQMQFFGARCNLAKALLYAINGGKDEISGEQIAPGSSIFAGEYLDYSEVKERFEKMTSWLAEIYIKMLNAIHYSHDKYAYERIQMALHDKVILRTMAGGIAGLSVVVDAFSAIKHTRVKIIRNAAGLAIDFDLEGDYPQFGNNDDRVDLIAHDIVKAFMQKLRTQPTYRNSKPTMSILTITSNVVYGKKTGNTPDGRKAGEPFAPGANPMHGRDKNGALASMASVAKLPSAHAEDGISYTFSIVPKALGKNLETRINNLVGIIDGYFHDKAHHINVNVFDKETLLDAMERPELYPQLTIRVSGYAVNFTRLTREQQLDVLNRTFHDNL